MPGYDTGDFPSWDDSQFYDPNNPTLRDRWWSDPGYLAGISSGMGGLFGGDRGQSGGGPGSGPAPSGPPGLAGGYDSQSGLPHALTEQIWQLDPPQGLDTSGYTADTFVQRGLPIWASQRFQEMADQLGGWDKLQGWLSDATNWSTVLGIMRNPWGQSTYDQYPQQAGQQPAPNEGQTTQVPEGQGGPQGVDQQGNPTYGTTVTGAQDSSFPAWAAAPIAGAGLAGIFAGGGSAPPPLTQPGPQQPTFSTTVTAPSSQDPLGGAELPAVPNFSTTVTGQMPQGTPLGGPTLGGPTGAQPPQPPPAEAPMPVPWEPPVGAAAPPATTAPAPGTPQVPQVPGAAAGPPGLTVPAVFPTLAPHAPISSLFQLPQLAPLVPGLNQILQGRI